MSKWTDARNAVTHPFTALTGSFSGKKTNKDNNNAQEALDQARHAYDGLSAPELAGITPDKVGNTAVSFHGSDSQAGWDPQARQAQTAQMAALQQLAANGGRSAASDANLAHIRQQEGAQAQGLRGAAMADASRRGGLTGNQSLLAQLAGNQAAANTGAMQGADLAGQMSNTALQAGMGSASIGAGLQGQSNQIAQAKDIMSRYNSGQDLASQQFNSGQIFDKDRFNSQQGLAAQQYNSGLPMKQFDANLQIAHGKAGGAQAATKYYGDKYKQDATSDAAARQGLINTVLPGGAMVMKAMGNKGDGGGAGEAAMAGPDMGDAAQYAAYANKGGELPRNLARGGEVPGPEVVKGDSLLNDIVPYKGPKGSQINLSGGEVVVPKTMRDAPDHEIASFVKHPPKTDAPKSERSMRLSALARLKAQR